MTAIINLSPEELLKKPVLITREAAAILHMSANHFLFLFKKELLDIKPLPFSNHIKYWSSRDIKRIIDNNTTPQESDDETATLLRAFNGDNQGALLR